MPKPAPKTRTFVQLDAERRTPRGGMEAEGGGLNQEKDGGQGSSARPGSGVKTKMHATTFTRQTEAVKKKVQGTGQKKPYKSERDGKKENLLGQLLTKYRARKIKT